MSEEEQEKLYELLFKDTKNKLEATIEEQQNKIASQEKQIKLMQSCDLAKVIKKQEKEIEELKSQLDFIGEQNKHIDKLQKELNKEKSLNKMIKSKTFKDICYNIGEFDNRFISKEKLNKAIKELQDKLGIAEELQDKI